MHEQELAKDRWQRGWEKAGTLGWIAIIAICAVTALFFIWLAFMSSDYRAYIAWIVGALVLASIGYDTWMRHCLPVWAPREFSTHDGSSDWATLDEVTPLFGSKKNEAPRTQRDLLRNVSGTPALVHRS